MYVDCILIISWYDMSCFIIASVESTNWSNDTFSSFNHCLPAKCTSGFQLAKYEAVDLSLTRLSMILRVTVPNTSALYTLHIIYTQYYNIYIISYERVLYTNNVFMLKHCCCLLIIYFWYCRLKYLKPNISINVLYRHVLC